MWTETLISWQVWSTDNASSNPFTEAKVIVHSTEKWFIFVSIIINFYVYHKYFMF